MLRRSRIFTKRRLLILIFTLIEVVLLTRKITVKSNIEIVQKSEIKFNQPLICKGEIDFKSIDNKAYITTNGITQENLKNFVFETTYLNNSLVLDYNSFENISIDSDTAKFDINFPFLTSYTGKFHCLNYSSINQNYRKPPSLNNSYITSNELKFIKNSFTSTNKSELICFGDNFDNRYCNSSNIYYKNRNLIFVTDAFYEFPLDFVLLSPRNATDIQSDRLRQMPIVSNAFPEYYEAINSTVYIMSFYQDFYNLLFSHYEFMFPIYATIQHIEGSINNFDREFILFHENQYFDKLFYVFSNKKCHNTSQIRDTIFIKNGVLGMKRFWNQVLEEPYVYNVKSEEIEGLKELAMSRLNITYNQTNVALFTLVERHFKNFINYRQFFDELKSNCPSANIIWTEVMRMDVVDIIRLAANSLVIVGQNSNALAAAFWMRAGSYLIELNPKGFDCDRYYQQIAEFSKINYIRQIDKNDNTFYAKTAEMRSKLPKCYDREDRCSDPDCYHRLKFQTFWSYPDGWDNTWKQICNSNFV